MTDRELYRRQTIERLKSEQREAREAIAEASAKDAKASAGLERISAQGEAPADACPACWYAGRGHVELSPISSPDDRDLFECRRCGFDEERPA